MGYIKRVLKLIKSNQFKNNGIYSTTINENTGETYNKMSMYQFLWNDFIKNTYKYPFNECYLNRGNEAFKLMIIDLFKKDLIYGICNDDKIEIYGITDKAEEIIDPKSVRNITFIVAIIIVIINFIDMVINLLKFKYGS